MLMPMYDRNKLAFVLLQFPPWFDIKKHPLQFAAELLKPFKVAVNSAIRLGFKIIIKKRCPNFHSGNVIHSICDEPQAGIGSVPC